jgi:septal ring factor EnvC (AmiA/AmiB activator)
MPTEENPVTPAAATPAVEPSAVNATFTTWEDFLEKQDEQVKSLYNTHSEALMNTVRATRDERDGLAKQIKSLVKEQADGSKTKAQLEEISAQLEKTERRAAFLEESAKPEIQCKNARAAFLLAEAEGLWTKQGTPDWLAIKREAPELFGVPVANANAGRSTQTPPPPKQNMNDFIRAAAGRK